MLTIAQPSDEYFAGLIDGEGWIGMVRMKTVIQVQMTHEATVAALHNRYGGSFVRRPPASARHKMVWRWEISGRTARRVLIAIRPFVITKKDDLEQAIRHLKETGEW